MRSRTFIIWIAISCSLHAAILGLNRQRLSSSAATQRGPLEIGLVRLLPTRNPTAPGEETVSSPATKSQPLPFPPMPEEPATAKPKPVNRSRAPRSPAPQNMQKANPPAPAKMPAPLATPKPVSPPPQPSSEPEEASPPASSAGSESNHAAALETNIPLPQPEKSEAFSLPAGNDPQPASPRQQAPGLRLPPRYWLNPPPPYPSLALKRQWQGEVRLRVLIDEQGQVIEAQVENSSGYEILDQSALEAVHDWKFHPAQQGNEKIRQEASIPIRFELK